MKNKIEKELHKARKEIKKLSDMLNFMLFISQLKAQKKEHEIKQLKNKIHELIE